MRLRGFLGAARSTMRSVSRTSRVIRRVDVAQDRALELGAEAIHVDVVPELTAHHAGLAATADLLEAGPLIGPNARRIELEDHEHDVAQAKGGEREVEHE